MASQAGPDGAWQRRFPIAAGHAGFDGHFPGDPILPAIVQIGLLLDALRDRLGPDVSLTALPTVRWRSVVRPGASLDLTARGPTEDGRVSCEMRSGETLVSSGSAVVRRAGP